MTSHSICFVRRFSFFVSHQRSNWLFPFLYSYPTTVNPFETPFSINTAKVLARPQQSVVISKPSKTSLGDAALSLQLEKSILKSNINKLDEGDGTRLDFFDQVCYFQTWTFFNSETDDIRQVKIAYLGVKYLTYATALTGAFLIYRRYTK